jgi:hypothetical protein
LSCSFVEQEEYSTKRKAHCTKKGRETPYIISKQPGIVIIYSTYIPLNS